MSERENSELFRVMMSKGVNEQVLSLGEDDVDSSAGGQHLLEGEHWERLTSASSLSVSLSAVSGVNGTVHSKKSIPEWHPPGWAPPPTAASKASSKRARVRDDAGGFWERRAMVMMDEQFLWDAAAGHHLPKGHSSTAVPRFAMEDRLNRQASRGGARSEALSRGGARSAFGHLEGAGRIMAQDRRVGETQGRSKSRDRFGGEDEVQRWDGRKGQHRGKQAAGKQAWETVRASGVRDGNDGEDASDGGSVGVWEGGGKGEGGWGAEFSMIGGGVGLNFTRGGDIVDAKDVELLQFQRGAPSLGGILKRGATVAQIGAERPKIYHVPLRRQKTADGRGGEAMGRRGGVVSATGAAGREILLPNIQVRKSGGWVGGAGEK